MLLSEWVYKPNKYEKKLMEEDPRLANIAIDSAILAQAAMTILPAENLIRIMDLKNNAAGI